MCIDTLYITQVKQRGILGHGCLRATLILGDSFLKPSVRSGFAAGMGEASEPELRVSLI